MCGWVYLSKLMSMHYLIFNQDTVYFSTMGPVSQCISIYVALIQAATKELCLNKTHLVHAVICCSPCFGLGKHSSKLQVPHIYASVHSYIPPLSKSTGFQSPSPNLSNWSQPRKDLLWEAAPKGHESLACVYSPPWRPHFFLVSQTLAYNNYIQQRKSKVNTDCSVEQRVINETSVHPESSCLLMWFCICTENEK